MKRFKFLWVFLLLILTSCMANAPDATLSGDPMDVRKEQIYYDPIDLKLVKFNPNGNTSEIINNDQTSYAYDINGADNLFIIGDAHEHIFKLVEIEGTEMKTLKEFNQGEEVLPLGYNAGSVYFIHSYYEGDEEDREKRTISLINLETYEITEIESVGGYLTDGIVSPNNIYYTVFNDEFNYYELHRKSIEEGKKAEAPELISVGYESADLYLSKDLENEKEIISLYASDNNRIYSKDENWPKFEANFFKPTSMLGLDKKEDGTMHMTFIEKRSKEVINEVDNVVGIRFEADTVVVATTDYGASKY